MRSTALLAFLSLSLLGAGGFAAAVTPLAEPVDAVRKLVRAGDTEAAVEAGDKAIETRADDAHAWLWAARAYGRQAQEASMLMKPKWAGRAREAWEKAIELDAGLIDARLDLIEYYLLAPGFLGGGRDKADAQAAAIANLDQAFGKLAAARLASADKDYPRAETLLREGLTIAPDNNRVRQALAGLLQTQTRWADVRALWNEVLQRRPDDAFALYQIGRAAALSGEDLDNGLASIDRFIANAVIPEDLSMGAAHWRRGQILAKLGRADEAIAAMQIATHDAAIRAQAEADLKKLRKG